MRAVGYTCKTQLAANRLQNEILARPHVRRFIELSGDAELMDAIMQKNERMEILSSIVRSSTQQTPIKSPVKNKDGEDVELMNWDPQSAVRAINELNKMDGSHAPKVKEISGPGGKPLEVKAIATDMDPAEAARLYQEAMQAEAGPVDADD